MSGRMLLYDGAFTSCSNKEITVGKPGMNGLKVTTGRVHGCSREPRKKR
jgi:hypothetical protein